MSAIFGILHTDQSPVDNRQAAAMQQALHHWGPDGQKTLGAGNVVLGQQLLFNTPQAQLETLPCQTEEGLMLTAEARLDNRDELCGQFNIAQADRARTPDGALILRAYETWGEGCPDHLLGDWSFAVFDPAKQKLFLARDHHGNTALYYYQNARRFVFASSRSALLAIDAPRRLNELFLAQLLVSWHAFHGAQTIDRDIMRLPPAHAMTVTPEETRVWQYWHLADTPELQLGSFEAYVEGLLEVYTEAVRCRLRTHRPVGATLSGGLDSGSVTALAARELQQRGQRLAAFTSVALHDVENTVGPNRFGDELAYAQASATHCSNVDLYPVNAANMTPIAGARRSITLLQEPLFAASNFYWMLELLQTAQGQGLGVLLTGQGGNATVSWRGWPELHSLRLMRKRHGWRGVARHLLPTALLRAVQLARSRRARWQHSAIKPEFARRLNLARRRAAAIGGDDSPVESCKTARAVRHSMMQPGSNMVGGIWAELGAAFQMEIRDPTLDRRVMSYTYSIPDHVFAGENGEERRLIRAAMDGLLPDTVRLNRERGRQAADLGRRLQTSADEVEDMLARLKKGPALNYLNLARMREVWADVQADPGPLTTHRATTILMRGIGAGFFLNEVW